MKAVELTADTWPLLVDLFGPNGAVTGCWCTFFLRDRADWRAGQGDGNRDFLHSRLGDPLGVLAVEDEAALGWVAVAPRPYYPRLATMKAAAGDYPADTWSVTCFFIHRTARRRGVAKFLLEEAVLFAAERGAKHVEGYPVDTGGAKKGSGDLYHGTLAMFLDAGFGLVERKGTNRALVRRAV
ncbi:GNAT family N-acetyltransferase [Saccharothrix variisporea]|uniref:Acetyltransferase (GNAT) family protein n=1 Tax=Saccharothrix variisporea TaxID=543527 RepID=A0A495XFA0_9PSEU|nr:GNAT family N-acetyltransferase [Saccharothrix variisporea]RKT72369.1 acetyltransferase (GNAT) family protein [Saccharothrix variisporea]